MFFLKMIPENSMIKYVVTTRALLEQVLSNKKTFLKIKNLRVGILLVNSKDQKAIFITMKKNILDRMEEITNDLPIQILIVFTKNLLIIHKEKIKSTEMKENFLKNLRENFEQTFDRMIDDQILDKIDLLLIKTILILWNTDDLC